MRKIEQEMVKAVKDRRSWKSDNTEVCAMEESAAVYLYGHCIAVYDRLGGNPNNNTWKQWPTRTTASRLRALGFVYDKKADRWN